MRICSLLPSRVLLSLPAITNCNSEKEEISTSRKHSKSIDTNCTYHRYVVFGFFAVVEICHNEKLEQCSTEMVTEDSIVTFLDHVQLTNSNRCT